MSRAALPMSAVSSTKTGGLPAPAPMPRFPEESTAVTTPGPPVATIRGMSGCFIIALLLSSVGFATVAAITEGPPKACEAALTSFTANCEVFAAPGCGLKTTALPPASMPMVLHSTVSEGLVEGVIAPMTPKGPISVKVRPRSPDQARVVMSSVPGVFSATSLCFRILSPTLPMPVSSTPMRAKVSAF